MMTFGQDRLPEKERWCQAWPQHPEASANLRYLFWIKGAADQVTYRTCSSCGGPFGYNAKWQYGGEPGAGPRHEKYTDCLIYMETHPIGRMYGPTLAELEDGPEVIYVEHGEIAAAPVMSPAIVAEDGGRIAPCARCGRSDFRTPKGRDWHIANNPDCAKYRKPDRHAYATL